MAEAEEAAKRKRRVPKGTSAYQAAWIVDDEGSADEGADEYEELVEYASDQEHPHTPGAVAESEFGGMTEFADAETDAMEVLADVWHLWHSSVDICTPPIMRVFSFEAAVPVVMAEGDPYASSC